MNIKYYYKTNKAISLINQFHIAMDLQGCVKGLEYL